MNEMNVVLSQPVERVKTSFPRRTAFSTILRSSFSEEAFTTSDLTDVIKASTLTSLGAAIVGSERKQRLSPAASSSS